MGLINTPSDIKMHNSAVDHQIEIKSVQSFIDDAINNHIIPAIGRTCFDELVNAREELTDLQRPLFEIVQKACVGFFLGYYAVSGALQINDSGISVAKGTNFAPASDKKLMALRKESFENGYGALERATEYLEENIDAFLIYKNSVQHKQNKELLINTSSEFQRAGININSSAQLYQVLRIYQGDAERTYINPLLGDDLYTLVRAWILEDSGNEIQKQLINEIRRPVASFTMLEAIPYMAISIDATGIYQLSTTVGEVSGNVAEASRLQAAMYRLQIKGDSQLETLRKWIAKHKAEFLAYTVPTEILMNDDPNSNIFYL